LLSSFPRCSSIFIEKNLRKLSRASRRVGKALSEVIV
jgi:hypothetical protein